jgi:hypothetical protein
MVSDTGEIQPDERLNCCLRHGDGTVFPVMIAHQGGWDEILWVMIPITAMVGLLLIATKRVRAANSGDDGSDSGDIGAE